MTLTEARRLRDQIRARGIHCVTPTGHGPDRYFARILTDRGPREFRSQQEWFDYLLECEERHQAFEAEMEANRRKRMRSPLDIMIDRACGRTP